MSHNKSYIITTLSGNLRQHSTIKISITSASAGVFSQGSNSVISLRGKCAPYTVVPTREGDEENSIIKFPFGTKSGCKIDDSEE